jgi:hypothetical protein
LEERQERLEKLKLAVKLSCHLTSKSLIVPVIGGENLSIKSIRRLAAGKLDIRGAR